MALYFWELEGLKASAVIDMLIDEARQAHTEKARTTYSISQLR
jgi:hypothetical protein